MSNERRLELCIAVGMFIVLLVLNTKIILYVVVGIGGFLVYRYRKLIYEYRRFFNLRFWLLVLILYFSTHNEKSDNGKNNNDL